MATATTEETSALGAKDDEPLAEKTGDEGQEKEKGLPEPKSEEPGGGVEPKMEEADSEASDDKPAAEPGEAAAEAVTDAAEAVNQDTTAANEESEQKSEPLQSPGDCNEAACDSTVKEIKEEQREESGSPGIDCEKSKTICEDGEKPSGGGGELGDKRRPSVEMSSSDGEPLSRMDSEDRLGWATGMVKCPCWPGCEVVVLGGSTP